MPRRMTDPSVPVSIIESLHDLVRPQPGVLNSLQDMIARIRPTTNARWIHGIRLESHAGAMIAKPHLPAGTVPEKTFDLVDPRSAKGGSAYQQP
jgi:hypothetical protein